MLVISDASTLILLQKIRLLECLVKKFRFAITPQVRNEAVEKGKAKNAPDAYAIEKKLTKGEVSVEQPKNNKLIEDIMSGFGTELGETETIALYLETKKGIVAVDDRKPMRVCSAYDVPFTTALALVLMSKDLNLLTIEEAKKMIMLLGSYGRYKYDLINKALEMVEGETNDK